jgi:hypothetical protein
VKKNDSELVIDRSHDDGSMRRLQDFHFNRGIPTIHHYANGEELRTNARV